ncbi:MAG: 23S rRNA (uracil(1939)-C(5))-methyltransferase RlmD [Pseudomonadota bacterium]
MARRIKEPIEVSIDNLSHEGRGVGRVDGKTVFVHGALPGETALSRITKRRRQFDEALALEVRAPAAARIAPRCQHFDICGGCALQHMKDPLAHKQNVLLELLAHHADLEPDQVQEPIAKSAWGYRRKARLGVKHVAKKGGVLVGFRERAKPFIADLTSCEVLHPVVGADLIELRRLLAPLSIVRQVPQIEVAVADNGVALVIRHLAPFSAADLAWLHSAARANNYSIFLQPGNEDTVVHFSGEPKNLYYEADDIRFSFEPLDFTQVNFEINQALIALVIDELDLGPTDTVVELFCGIGNFSLPMAKRAARVLSYEGESRLITRAQQNAEANGVTKAEFFVQDLYNDPHLQECGNKLMLDPPRSGAQQVLVNLNNDFDRIVYVSCNPVTLARDTAILSEKGYRLSSVRLLDMFPHTAHVESCAVFDR